MEKGIKTITRLLAASAIFASGAAMAQSSVTLYGLVDGWLGAKKALNGHTAYTAGNGGMTVPYWGIRGSEDIGGGNSVIFDLESYFNIQNGVVGRFAGDGLFSRNAWVGMKGNWGTLTMGEMGPPLWFSTIFYNPFFNSFAFSPMVIQSYVGVNHQGIFSAGGTDWANAVQYVTPTIGGANVKAAYAFGNDAGHLGQNKWSVQLNYSIGSLATSSVYQQMKYNQAAEDIGSVIPGMRSQSAGSFNMTYGFNTLKLYAQYMHIWNAISTGDVGIDTGQLGFSWAVGPGQVLASDAYSHSTGASNVSRNTWAVGYDYQISKRTDVYVAVLGDRASKMSSGFTAGGGLRTTF
jgi:predicted porin